MLCVCRTCFCLIKLLFPVLSLLFRTVVAKYNVLMNIVLLLPCGVMLHAFMTFTTSYRYVTQNKSPDQSCVESEAIFYDLRVSYAGKKHLTSYSSTMISSSRTWGDIVHATFQGGLSIGINHIIWLTEEVSTLVMEEKFGLKTKLLQWREAWLSSGFCHSITRLTTGKPTQDKEQ